MKQAGVKNPVFLLDEIDKMTSDMRGGSNAGIRTCWFDPKGRPARPDIVPDHRITALAQLPALLERL